MWYVACGKYTVKKAKRWCEGHGDHHADREAQNKCIPIHSHSSFLPIFFTPYSPYILPIFFIPIPLYFPS
jgi:hypothetical protein